MVRYRWILEGELTEFAYGLGRGMEEKGLRKKSQG